MVAAAAGLQGLSEEVIWINRSTFSMGQISIDWANASLRFMAPQPWRKSKPRAGRRRGVK